MKILKFLALALALAALSVLTFLGYYGYFTDLEIEQGEIANEVLVFYPMQGSYSNAKHTMDKVYNELLTEYSIDTKQGFGIYLDNPNVVDEAELRSQIGCILPDSLAYRKDELATRFQVRELSLQRVVRVRFPFKGGASIFVGLLKVYPALQNYFQQNGQSGIEHPVMELYDVPNKTIEYRVLLP